MSPQVAVVTDSAASLPYGIAEEMGITVVPIYLRFGDRAVPDDEGLERFYERLRSATKGATTAARRRAISWVRSRGPVPSRFSA